MGKAKKAEAILEEKTADLIGADAIERHVGRSSVSWAKWRKFGFPARKVRGNWQAVSAEVDEWVRKAGGEEGAKAISEERLWRDHIYRPYLQGRTAQTIIEGYAEIQKLYGYSVQAVHDRLKRFDSFPVIRDKRQVFVDDAVMRLWMLDHEKKVILHLEDRFPAPSPI